MPTQLEVCPNCRYTLLRRTVYCPHCGFQLSHPTWKKMGAWVLLILFVYGLVTCHLRIMDGFDQL